MTDEEEELVAPPLSDVLDLHTFAPRDVPEVVVQAYLEEAVTRGWKTVRIIHGKGIGVQRQIVQRILEKHPHVSSFHAASEDAGGWGATLVQLR